MSTFQKLIDNVKDGQQHVDMRLATIKDIEKQTGRPLIVYASDFRKGPQNMVNMEDKTGFSDLLEGIVGDDLDILIHSPGGYPEAAEMLVDLVRGRFSNVRYIVPNAAKSAATMMCLSGNAILLDDRSELGPIDPQFLINGGSVPAKTILDGFAKTRTKLGEDGGKNIHAYIPLLSKYDLHLLEMAQNAIDLSRQLAERWLTEYMFKGQADAADKAGTIAGQLSNHTNYLSHGRAIGITSATAMGLNVVDMRGDQKLRKAVWNLYCLVELFFDRSPNAKLYENSRGVTWARRGGQQELSIQIPMPGQPQKGPPAVPTPVPGQKRH